MDILHMLQHKYFDINWRLIRSHKAATIRSNVTTEDKHPDKIQIEVFWVQYAPSRKPSMSYPDETVTKTDVIKWKSRL